MDIDKVLDEYGDYLLRVAYLYVKDENTANLFSLLQYDSFKSLLLVGVFLVIYTILKCNIRKNNRTFPVCTNCGEEWTRKQSLKSTLTNKEIMCPNCGVKQFQTKRSTMKVSMFHFLIPFTILFANLFNNALIGVSLHLLLVVILFISLAPYYMVLQKDNPDNDPLW